MGDTTVSATTRQRAATYDVVVRPRRSLVRSTILSVVFSAVPLAVALVWVSLPLRLWPVVAAAVIASAVLVGVVFVRLGAAFIGVDPACVTVRGVVTPNRRIGRDRVHRLVVATTYGSVSERTTRELVALDAADTHLFSLRADVWGDDGIDRVVDALGVRVSGDARPLPAREFARRYPASRAWYEQRGAQLVVGALALVVVVGVLVVETAGLLGG